MSHKKAAMFTYHLDLLKKQLCQFLTLVSLENSYRYMNFLIRSHKKTVVLTSHINC